jgi:crotonobetainyl-CoA:carnitine CoA-transferase CaiB-like acyl-CoA transferase
MTEPQALSGLRIIDLSRWVAGEFATKLFADFGADVVKVERPGEGSLTRGWRAAADITFDREANPLFLHLNTNKRSIALDITAANDRRLLLDLVATADAVVESFRPGWLERHGLGPDVLASVNPRLVLTRITAFGQTGPYRDREATGIVLQAMGGPMHATGDGSREPLRKPGLVEQYTIGRAAAEATLAALRSVDVTGGGAVIDVSGQEALLASADRRASYLLSASYSGIDAPRGTRSAHRGRTTFTGPFRAKDGYVMVYVTNQAFWNRFVDLVGADAPEFRAQFHGRSDISADRDEFLAFVADWFAQRPKQQIMEDGMAARIPLTAMLEIDEVLEHRHFAERGTFVPVAHPVAGELRYPGPPWRMAGGFALRTAAPRLDEHADAVRAEVAERRGTPRSAATFRGPRAPLEGIRIVDLTVVWAGPGATALLGDLGAEVIRIEANNRTSRQVSAAMTKELVAAMGYHAATYPDADPGPRPYDRSALFNWHARNKLSACMNLDTAEGRRAALELLAISDVFVENNSNGTLEKLGLGHEELLARNPRLIVARMPPMGMSGSMSDYLGYGPNFNSLVGIAVMDGYEAETPDTAGENYHMDEATPAGLAFAVLSALRMRERTGRGGLIEFPQSENVLHDIGEYFLSWQLTGVAPAILGNADPHMVQGVFRANGEDRWVALSLRSDAERAALEELVAGDGLGKDQLAVWTRGQDATELVARLQAAGIPAGEVLSEKRELGDPHLTARGWFQTRTHPAVGTHRYPGHPWRANGVELRYGRPLAGFGADNDYVYRTLLGYDEETYADLVRRGLVTEEQFA